MTDINLSELPTQPTLTPPVPVSAEDWAEECARFSEWSPRLVLELPDTRPLTVRALDPDADEPLVREAVSWINEQPRFFRCADAAWSRGETADDYLRLMRTEPQVDYGVFRGGELAAVVTASRVEPGVFNSHLLVRRGTPAFVVSEAAHAVLRVLFAHGMVEGWSWIAARNFGARRVLESIGMVRDGVEQIKGQSHGQPITWLRYTVRA